MKHATSNDGQGAVDAGARSPVSVSFEFFPPNDPEMERTLWASIQRLAPLAPRFVSEFLDERKP